MNTLKDRNVGGQVIWAAAAGMACLFLASSLPGCGGAAPGGGSKAQRVNASGKIEVDGKPIPAGTVTFTNIETGNEAKCPISDGTYASESGQGPNPGQNSVIVIGKETAEGNPMWSKAWTKTVEVVADKDFTEDFNVDSKKMKPFDPKTIIIDE
ncbi:MAG: hypothetical protein U0992_21105 [Planctomycetaceae bacterium]